jgi:hypothetical protein
MASVPTLSALLPILFDEVYCLRFLLDSGAFYRIRECPDCLVEMKLYLSSFQFRCPRKGCNRKASVKKNSFFERSRLKCCQIMHLAYLWLTKAGIDTATKHAGISRETTCEYYKYFRQLVTEGITLEDTVIGGEGVEVELDESKLGKSGDSN